MTESVRLPAVNPLGPSLRRLRESRGLSLRQAASLLGLPRSSLGRYESGRSAPTYDRVVVMVRGYGASLFELLMVTGCRAPHPECRKECPLVEILTQGLTVERKGVSQIVRHKGGRMAQ